MAGKKVVVVHVPRASRRHRPVYVGQNPLEGTYRRNFEGDYKCRPDEVGRMLADQSEEALDSRIVEGFGTADLDPASVQQYRQRFSARSPGHPWLAEEESSFLEKLGAWRKDRLSAQEGLTVAGLVMFGKDEAIHDPAAVPEFHLDYRERLSDDPEVRWTDRLTFDGTWVCNVFQFYQRVVVRLTADLKMPFQLQPDLSRKDDTIVHEAVREALVNALIHADYRGQGGVIAEKYRDRLEFSNPGTLLLDIEQILRGGVSECRNKTLQKMFALLGYGEKAGSGFDKIRRGWAAQQWRLPSIEETFRPDRVRLVLPMVSLLPEESLARLKRSFGHGWDRLSAVETQALVTADVEGRVSNARLREVSVEHPADLTKTLQALVGRGFLEQVGQKRGTFYRLSAAVRDSTQKDLRTPHITAKDSTHTEDDSTHKPEGRPETDPILLELGRAARERRRLPVETMQHIILGICSRGYLTPRQIGILLDRNPVGLQERYLRPMAQSGQLALRFPTEPNHPDQAYKTKTPNHE